MPVSMTPYRVFDSYRTIDPAFFTRRGIKLLLCDLDYTLAPKSQREPDDALRRAVIQQLMCHFELSLDALDTVYGIDSARYFATELAELGAMADAGLVRLEPRRLVVLPPGRMLVRAISMVFDAWLRAGRQGGRYSKVI